MACACVYLKIVDLDVEDDVCSVVDGKVGDAEALEFTSFGLVVFEGLEGLLAVVVKVGFPGVVGTGDARLPGLFFAGH